MLKTSHMQEMKRRYLSMYIPAETLDDQFNEHCGVCDEQGIEEAVLNEALKPRDKAVIDAFYSRKGNLASNLLSVEGGKLTKMGMGGQEIAIWKNDKIVINAKMDVKSTEEIVRYMKKSIPSGVFEEVEIDEAKGTAYPATIDTLKMIVREKQNQTVMFKSGQAIVDIFTASAMVAVYDAMKPATKKKFEKMIMDKGGFMKTQAFAMKMVEDVRWNDQIKEDPSLLESLLNEDPDMEKIVKELEGASKMHLAQSKRIQKHLDKMKSEEVEVTESTHGKKGTFTMAPFEDLRGVADVALKIMQGQPQEVKEEEQEVTNEETPQKLTE